MDVADRSVRLDAFPLTPATPEPPSEASLGTFATSLLRHQTSLTTPLAAGDVSAHPISEGMVPEFPEEIFTGLTELAASLPKVPPATDSIEPASTIFPRESIPNPFSPPRVTSDGTNPVRNSEQDAVPSEKNPLAEPLPDPSTGRTPESLAKAWQSSPAMTANARKADDQKLDEGTPPIPGTLQAALVPLPSEGTMPNSLAAEETPSQKNGSRKIESLRGVVPSHHVDNVPNTSRVPSFRFNPSDTNGRSDGRLEGDTSSSPNPVVNSPQGTPRTATTTESTAKGRVSLENLPQPSDNPVTPVTQSPVDLGVVTNATVADSTSVQPPSASAEMFGSGRIVAEERVLSPDPIPFSSAAQAEPLPRGEIPPTITGNAAEFHRATSPVPNVFEQVHPKLHEAILHDRQLTFALRPPELGLVRIDLLRQDGRLKARLQTETESAHRLLTEHLPQLQDALTQWGLTADEVRIVRAEDRQQEGAGFQRFGGGETGSHQEGQGQQNAPSPRQTPSPQNRDEPEREEVVRTTTALNLRI